MTDKTMTEVRGWHLEAYKVTGQPKHKDMADAITRHLSQTAERGEAVAKPFCFVPIHIVESANANIKQGHNAVLTGYTKQHDHLDVPLYAAPPPAAGVPDVRSDANNWGNALNAAAWLFVDVCPEKSALLFNHAKASLRAAILKYLDLVSATTSPAIDVAAVRDVPEVMRALYDAASKGFHISESCGPDKKYWHVSKFQSLPELFAFEDAWRKAMMAASKEASK